EAAAESYGEATLELRGVAARRIARGQQRRAAHHFVEALFSVPAARRRADREPGRVARLAKAVGTSARGAFAFDDGRAVECAGAARPELAARSRDARTALRHRLPRVGSIALADERRASRPGLLPLPRQGRQTTHRAAGQTCDRRHPRISGTRDRKSVV